MSDEPSLVWFKSGEVYGRSERRWLRADLHNDLVRLILHRVATSRYTTRTTRGHEASIMHIVCFSLRWGCGLVARAKHWKMKTFAQFNIVDFTQS